MAWYWIVITPLIATVLVCGYLLINNQEIIRDGIRTIINDYKDEMENRQTNG